MSGLERYRLQLPVVPIPLPPLEGRGLNGEALVAHRPYGNAQEAIVACRAANPAEAARYFRRYYFDPHMKSGRFLGKYNIKYVWNPDQNAVRSDRFVGVVPERGGMPDFARAQLLIGAHARGAWLPYPWHLCEDRDGENPLDMGRLDIFDLLRNVTAEDVERFRQESGQPVDQYAWDFPYWYFKSKCPQCGDEVSILDMAYDIDSAECAKCGVRPFLSHAIGRTLTMVLPSVTGRPEIAFDLDVELLGLVQWLGHVRAGVVHLHQEELPKEYTPHAVLKMMLQKSLIGPHQESNGTAIAPVLIDRLRDTLGGDTAATALSATNAVAQAIERGGPFSPIEASMADLLATMLRETA